MLRQLIQWLYLRFPPRLTVTLQDYNELRSEVAQLNIVAQGIQELNKRLMQIERDLVETRMANGFVGSSKGQFKLER
jgi:hypothetical protein